jgi:proline racemase
VPQIDTGPNFFAIVDAESLGIRVEMKNIRRLIELGLEIRDEVNGLEEIIHPENPYIKGVDLTMIYEKTGRYMRKPGMRSCIIGR